MRSEILPLRRQSHHSLSQQRWLYGGAAAGAKSRLVLQRSGKMALRRCAARSRMHRLVYRACRNAGRARCRSESSPRKQIGRIHRSHRWANGYAERPRLCAHAPEGIVRRSDLTKQHIHKKEKSMSEVISDAQPKPPTRSTTISSTNTVVPGSSGGSLDFGKLV